MEMASVTARLPAGDAEGHVRTCRQSFARFRRARLYGMEALGRAQGSDRSRWIDAGGHLRCDRNLVQLHWAKPDGRFDLLAHPLLTFCGENNIMAGNKRH